MGEIFTFYGSVGGLRLLDDSLYELGIKGYCAFHVFNGLNSGTSETTMFVDKTTNLCI
jgi:hypothetical protein